MTPYATVTAMGLNEDWRKSTRSQLANCVQVRIINGVVETRNSNDPDGPTVSYTPEEWLAFLDGVRAGEFNL